MKRIFSLLLLTATLIAATACRGAGYSDQFSPAELGGRLLTTLDAEDAYLEASDDALADYFEIPDYVTDHAVYFRADRNNLDEFGIFHTQEGRAKEMAAQLLDYLDRSLQENRAWYDSYIPAETPKLRDAEVRTFGNYAVYGILSNKDRERVFETLEETLRAAS